MANKKPKRIILTAELKKDDIDNLKTCKDYYGHEENSSMTRFLFRKEADRIKAEKNSNNQN
jgi:hypothetical protein